MRLLGIDCAGAACSAAIVADGITLARQQEPMSRGQAERIIPMIAEVLGQADLRADDMDAFAVTVGPGAFTGVRIGLSAALGLARATGKPAVGVTVTEVLAAGISTVPDSRLLIALDSKRPDPFCEMFDATPTGWTGRGARAVPGQPESLRQMTESDPQEGPLLLGGDFAPTCFDMLGYGVVCENANLCDPVLVARCGAEAMSAGMMRPPAPLYLRGADVSAPSKDRSRRPGISSHGISTKDRA